MSVQDDCELLLKTHGAKHLRDNGDGDELWSVARTTVRIPGRRKGKSDQAWMTARRDVRRALHAAGVDVLEPEVDQVAKSNGTTEHAPFMRVTTAATRDLPPAEAARALAEGALAQGERAEALAAAVESLVADLGSERRRAERAESDLANTRTRLDTKEAELARFNGRDWPKELEQAVAQKKAAQAETATLQAEVVRLKTALTALTAVGFGSK